MARILIVDDNADMLNMLRMVIERQTQHGVILAHSGKDALKKAFASPPDVALVDVMMPGISGYEVVQQLRADPKTENIGIIVLTARGQPVDREAALAAGADDHMSKPVDVDALVTRIASLLEKEPAAAPPSRALVLPLMSLKGGVGVSTLSVNVAVILQQIAATVLVDLSPNGGHCALFLGQRPDRHWGQRHDAPQPAYASLATKHKLGLHLLAAPPTPTQDRLSKEETLALIDQVRALGRLIVIDMPPTLDAGAQAVLDQAHRIVLITDDSPPALQTTRTTLQTLQPWQKNVLVVRNATAPGPKVPAEALQRALHTPLTADVPYDPAQVTAVRKGIVLAGTQAKTPLTGGLSRLIKAILKH
jgi:CheY-like chemotaxis protein/MinD-like ATPase involved in chromosome partitioning or flagellar assembly